MRKIVITLSLLTLLREPAYGETSPASLSVENAWARVTAASATTGAVYLTIVDHGAPDRLVAAATPVAGEAQLHQTTRDGDVMRMRPVDGAPVSSSAPTTFAPGGYHIMLVGLKQPLHEEQSFPLTLTFEKAGTIQTNVVVRRVGPGAPMPMTDPGHTTNGPMR